jgi:hypothetical protein
MAMEDWPGMLADGRTVRNDAVLVLGVDRTTPAREGAVLALR